MNRALELMNNQDFLQVKGWMHPNVITLLQSWALNYLSEAGNTKWPGATLEIGVHHGKMFLAMEAVTPPEVKCYAVDVFDDQHKNIDSSGKGNLEIFVSNIRKIAQNPERIIPVKGDSFSVREIEILPHDFSLISIDGGHTREHTAFDLRYADSTIKPGGLIILDDFANVNWLGVMDGTLDFLSNPERRIAPFMAGFNKLLFTTITECEETQNAMENHIRESSVDITLNRVSKLKGHDVRALR